MKKIVKNKIENLPTGDEKNFDHLYKKGYRLKSILTLKKQKGASDKDPIAVAILSNVDKQGVFLSVIFERGGDWLYCDATEYRGDA